MADTSFQIKTALRLALASVAIIGMTAACDNSPKQADNPSLAIVTGMPTPNVPISVVSTPLPAIPTQPKQPDHNYDERKGLSYYYISVVSEDDKKRGRVTGNVSEFQYLGQNQSAEHIIASIRPNGTVGYRAKCIASCRIIDTDDGEKIAYSPLSIIGGAFQDAFRGKLRIAEWAKDEVVAPSPARPNTVETPVAETTSKTVSDVAGEIKPSATTQTAENANFPTE